MLLLDLADTLRAAGLRVVEVTGWKTRGRGEMRTIEGVICHHTAGGPTGNYPSLGVVRDGRGGAKPLPGPLSQLGIARDGTVMVIAAGVSNHAGVPDRLRAPMTGNTNLIGIEAESTGVRRADGRYDWTAEQLEVYPLVTWALARRYQLSPDRIVGHGSADPIGWAPSRKSDPAGFSMELIRRVAGNPQHPYGDDMTAQFERDVRAAIERDYLRDLAFDRDVRADLKAKGEAERLDEVEDDAQNAAVIARVSGNSEAIALLAAGIADTRQKLEEYHAAVREVLLAVTDKPIAKD